MSFSGWQTNNFLFICFNGSFLKNRSKKGLFPKEVEEKHETRIKTREEHFLFQRRNTKQESKVLFICFNGSFLKNRSKKGLFQEQEGLQNRSSSASFVSRTAQRRQLFVSRKRRNTKWQVTSNKVLFQKRNGAVLLLLVSRTPCFKNSKKTRFCFKKKKKHNACFKKRRAFFSCSAVQENQVLFIYFKKRRVCFKNKKGCR